MKKLFYIISLPALVVLVGCKGKSTGGATTKITVACPTTPVVEKTLNGFARKDARQMIDDYCGNFNPTTGTSNYPAKSIHAWYCIKQIENMYNLLKCEGKADGVRFYLGSEATGGNPKNVNYHIFLITTDKGTGTGPGPINCLPVANQSSHSDYYEHNASYLTGSDPQFGDALPRNPVQAVSDGAGLYDNVNNPVERPCNTQTSSHYLDATIAHEWVLKRGINMDGSGFNTKSEWFDACFIKAVFHTILSNQSSPNYLSGLRVYLGKGFDDGSQKRDVFILVPTTDRIVPGPTPGSTTTIHEDYYDCLENLNPNEFNPCRTPRTATGRPGNQIKGDTAATVYFKHIKEYGFWFAGYDNGEMCPNSCN